MSTNAVALSADATTLDAAQANSKSSAEAIAGFLNNNLKTYFLGAFNNWKGPVENGTASPDNPPHPPKSFVAVKMDNGFYDVQQTGPAVCDMPPLPSDHRPVAPGDKPKNHIHVGIRLSGDWFSAGTDDTIPSGQKVPGVSEDGVQGFFTKYGAPVGNGWYLLAG